MAQQDCGQCGYNCNDYSEALFSGEREAAEPLRARRQGNRPDAQDALRRRLKALPLQRDGAADDGPPAADATAAPAAPGRSRDNPVDGGLLVAHAPQQARAREKETLACRIRPLRSQVWITRWAMRSACSRPNDPALADAVIAALERAAATFRSAAATLREVLIDGVSLGLAPDMLFQLYSYITGGDRRQKAKCARCRRGSRWRCRDPRRAGGDSKIFRRAARSRGLHRGARSAPAAALFDRVVAQGRSWPCGL